MDLKNGSKLDELIREARVKSSRIRNPTDAMWWLGYTRGLEDAKGEISA